LTSHKFRVNFLYRSTLINSEASPLAKIWTGSGR